ncbi:uncharacterized protein BX664DRAFT_103330 [Halteromyces radiatus]|uniref:uncharacterized protein n=1 Tax=Halteromyces radiatus TaxID=101107 RepID=UPI00222072CB|nr:uncharacterized protein BX664DRAFT_103330 [Halteromyces radiatus]KAI8093240.1 hypothetical protein BX664DRAFT_103330 [Halteromyces radiatus]
MNHSIRNASYDTYETQILPNMSTIHYIRQASAALDLPVRTTGIALCYYHRFHQFMSQHQGKQHVRNNQTVDPLLPLYTNEEPAKQQKFQGKYATWSMLDIGIIILKKMYYKWTSELLLVRALDCDLERELPFSFCLNVLRNMGSIPFFQTPSIPSPSTSLLHSSGITLQKEVWKQMENEMPLNYNVIARMAWMFVWDSLCSPKITLKYSVAEVALGCLYLALRTSYADLQMTMTEWVDKWGASDNVSVQAVRDVALDLLELYEQSSLSSHLDRKNLNSLPTSIEGSPQNDTEAPSTV